LIIEIEAQAAIGETPEARGEMTWDGGRRIWASEKRCRRLFPSTVARAVEDVRGERVVRDPE
jgi:hypothetical protein